jgi:predicted transcriptional regulator of viral defense system
MERGLPGSTRVRATELADWALSRGRPHLTTREVAELVDVPEDQVRRRLHAPSRRGEWVQPVRGLWFPVPPEFRTWGAPPGIEIVDAMMLHLNVQYYVGWLSAAALFGATHQAPQQFQVASSRDVRDTVVGRTHFVFRTRSRAGESPTVAWPTRAGTARVSSVEATILDVATDIEVAGGLDNAATVIVELSENEAFRVTALADIAERFPAAGARRAGWVLETFGGRQDLDSFAASASTMTRSASRLDPARSLAGTLDDRWGLRLNADVEPDL